MLLEKEPMTDIIKVDILGKLNCKQMKTCMENDFRLQAKWMKIYNYSKLQIIS